MAKIAYIAEKKIKKIKKPKTLVYSAFRGNIVLKQPILLKKKFENLLTFTFLYDNSI
jgi:hypothetical protein